MSTIEPHRAEMTDRADRRGALRLGATAAAAGGLAAIAATNAEAAAGQPVVQGVANTVGTAGTTISSSGTAITLTGKNTGAGAAAFFFANNNNGFAGGTGSGNSAGLSAANTGPAGTGSAVTAVGKNNNGVVCNTTNSEKFAVVASNKATTIGNGAAILASGGANPGLVAVSDTDAIVAVGSIYAMGDVVAEDGLFVTLSSAAQPSAMFAPVTIGFPEVLFHGKVDTPTATTTIPLDSAFQAVADPASVSVVATPNSGPMPNLYASVTGSGSSMELVLNGCVAGGTVSVSIAAPRTDYPAPALTARTNGPARKYAALSGQ